jgi:DNA modification methylase
MIVKVLNNTEVIRGFIKIPTAAMQELIGETDLPTKVVVNGTDAHLDKQGRIWSNYLRNRYSVGEEVSINRTGNIYKIAENNPQVAGRNMVEIIEDNQQKQHLSDKQTPWHRVIEGDCINRLTVSAIGNVDLTFFDPPYNQGKNYRYFDDKQPDEEYWGWVRKVLKGVFSITQPGGSIYFMQREKNTEKVLEHLRKTGWNFQNLIIWKKKTSAVPCGNRYSKQYQIIAYAIKGDKPRTFNKLRIDPPALPEHKYKHENGVYVTDVWDDIREMTSGYFAGEEAIRDDSGNRVHTQQSPISLLLRIILSSSKPGNVVLDPVAGTGTTMVVANQLGRNSIGIEIDPAHVELIKKRLNFIRPSDRVSKYISYYRFTQNLNTIWDNTCVNPSQKKLL